MEHWYSSNDQRVIIGLSDCSLLFSIGTFHTNSFLCHPLDCTEVLCFWTLQYFRYIMIVGAIWWRWCTSAAAAVGVWRHYHCCQRRRFDSVATCVGRDPVLASANANHVVIGSGALPPPPLPWASAAAAHWQPRHCRRRRWRDLPPASTGVLAGPGRRLPSGSATLSTEQ